MGLGFELGLVSGLSLKLAGLVYLCVLGLSLGLGVGAKGHETSQSHKQHMHYICMVMLINLCITFDINMHKYMYGCVCECGKTCALFVKYNVAHLFSNPRVNSPSTLLVSLGPEFLDFHLCADSIAPPDACGGIAVQLVLL